MESNESNMDEKSDDSLELESETGESEIVETTIEHNSELENENSESNEEAESNKEIKRNEIAYEVTENVDKSNGAINNKIEKLEANSIREEETQESTSDDENTYVEMHDEIIALDFGTIAVLGIFFSITDTFVDSGFGTALIRKFDRAETDFSTVFIFNIIVSFFLCDSVPYSTFGVFILWNAYTHIYFKSTGNLYRVWRAYGRT